MKTIDFLKPAMIPVAHTAPGVAFTCDFVPLCTASLLVDFSRFIKGWVYFHDCLIVPEYQVFFLDPSSNGVIIQPLNFGIKPSMESANDEQRELSLLEQIESDPNVNQSTLATQLGVAVGTVNWHLKRLIAKGAVKVSRAERKKLRYIITPEGIALRARLAVDYVERSLTLYRRTRQRVKEHIAEIRRAGYDRVRIVGEGDVADICKLTCLEQGITVVKDKDAPSLVLDGHKVRLEGLE
jgi:DNA-binding MarR family transcriptional regulator